MSKNFNDTVFEIFQSAVDLEIASITSDSNGVSSRHVSFNGKNCINFGLNDYLGLTKDSRLKNGAIRAIERHGSYTSLSKVYIKIDIYQEAEDYLEKVFNKPCLLFSRTTIAHTGVLPAVVNPDDAVLVDQFAHASIKNAAVLLSSNGISVEIIKHNNIDVIESKIKELSGTFKNIWYLCDSVYSMHGDSFPYEYLKILLNKYDNFKLYVDDSHGVSWAGENGRGFGPDRIGYHKHMMFVTSLGKGFGSGGGLAVFFDKETKHRCEICALPLAFSSPISPPTLGAIIESAKIHLTTEIYKRQADLRENIEYFTNMAKDLDLHIIGDEHSPVFLFPLAKYEITNEVCLNMINKGIYLCVAYFPAVPLNNSGVRIMICNYHTKADIDLLLLSLKECLDKALESRNLKVNDLLKFFKVDDIIRKEQTVL